RNTCVLFGDGAGAAILRHRGSAHGVISTHIGSDAQYTDILFMPGGGSRCPITRENVDLHLQTIHMTGKEVYKQAVTAMLKAAKKPSTKLDWPSRTLPVSFRIRLICASSKPSRIGSA